MSELPSPQLHIDGDGVAHSLRFGDVYASSAGAFEQAEYVYLQGCELPGRFAAGNDSSVLELGIGLGVNFLVTAENFLAQAHPHARLHYIGIEGFPVDAGKWPILLASVPEQYRELAHQLAATWPNPRPEVPAPEGLDLRPDLRGWHTRYFAGARVRLTLILAPVFPALLQINQRFDAVYLDGFSPAKNPEMWEPRVLAQVVAKLHAGARLASFSATGDVTRTLKSLGIGIQKRKGFAYKRECIRGKEGRERSIRIAHAPRHIAVIGAGIAGLTCAFRLQQRFPAAEIQVLDRDVAFSGASGAPTVLIHAPTSSESSIDYQLQLAGFRAMLQWLSELQSLGIETGWQALAISQRRKYQSDSESPIGGRLSPQVLLQGLRRYLNDKVKIIPHTAVQNIAGARGAWTLHTQDGKHFSDEVVLASGYCLSSFMPEIGLRFVQGQIEVVRSITSARAWCGESVVVPISQDELAIGNSFERHALRQEPSNAVREHLLQQARHLAIDGLNCADWQWQRSWLGTRAQCAARLPRIGLHRSGRWVSLAHASKGFSTGILAANWIASAMGAAQETSMTHDIDLPVLLKRALDAWDP